MQNDNLDPWSIDIKDFFRLKTSKEKIIFLLKFGILAPSTHNSQPWLFKIERNICEIYSNPTILIKEADPTGRDLFISFGCLLENIYVAASYYNIPCKIDYVLDLKKNFVARVIFNNLSTHLNEQIKYESLLLAITKRQTVRGIFEDKKIDNLLVKSLKSTDREIVLNSITDTPNIEKLSRLTAEGLRIAYKSRNFRKEMANWFRNNISKEKEGLPGYSLKMPTLLSFIFPTLVRYFDVGNIVSSINYKSMSSAKMICVLSSESDNKRTWSEVGRQAQRIMLLLTSKNIMTSIFVAAVEMGELYREVQKILNINTRPQFILCAGYMNKSQKHTPRHSVYEKIIN